MTHALLQQLFSANVQHSPHAFNLYIWCCMIRLTQTMGFLVLLHQHSASGMVTQVCAPNSLSIVCVRTQLGMYSRLHCSACIAQQKLMLLAETMAALQDLAKRLQDLGKEITEHQEAVTETAEGPKPDAARIKRRMRNRQKAL